MRPKPALIEIIERTTQPEQAETGGIMPNEVRINGTPLLIPNDQPVVIHETSIRADEFVTVTMTLCARRIIIGPEDDRDDTPTEMCAREGGVEHLDPTEEAITTMARPPGTPLRVHHFCGRCGTHLPATEGGL